MVAWLMHRWPNVLSHCCDDSSWQGCISWNRSFAFDQWAMTCNHCAPRSTQTCAADLERSVSKALLHCILSHCWTGQGSERWDRQGRRATAKALPRLYQHLCAKKRSYGRWFNLFLKAWNTSWLHQTRRNACQWGMAACSQPSDMQNIWEDSDSERKWDCWWRCKPGWNPNFIRAHVFVLKVTWWIWQPLEIKGRSEWSVFQTVGLVSKNLFPTCLPFLDASGDWRQGSQGWQCHQCVDFSWPFIANSTLLWFIYSLLNLLDIKTQRCACACYHEALPWTILSVEFIIISFWDSLSFWVIVKLPCLCVHIYIQHRTAASSA